MRGRGGHPGIGDGVIVVDVGAHTADVGDAVAGVVVFGEELFRGAEAFDVEVCVDTVKKGGERGLAEEIKGCARDLGLPAEDVHVYIADRVCAKDL